jgi:hypothetical protein
MAKKKKNLNNFFILIDLILNLARISRIENRNIRETKSEEVKSLDMPKAGSTLLSEQPR